jgi:hypothetical protein
LSNERLTKAEYTRQVEKGWWGFEEASTAKIQTTHFASGVKNRDEVERNGEARALMMDGFGADGAIYDMKAIYMRDTPFFKILTVTDVSKLHKVKAVIAAESAKGDPKGHDALGTPYGAGTDYMTPAGKRVIVWSDSEELARTRAGLSAFAPREEGGSRGNSPEMDAKFTALSAAVARAEDSAAERDAKAATLTEELAAASTRAATQIEAMASELAATKLAAAESERRLAELAQAQQQATAEAAQQRSHTAAEIRSARELANQATVQIATTAAENQRTAETTGLLASTMREFMQGMQAQLANRPPVAAIGVSPGAGEVVELDGNGAETPTLWYAIEALVRELGREEWLPGMRRAAIAWALGTRAHVDVTDYYLTNELLANSNLPHARPQRKRHTREEPQTADGRALADMRRPPKEPPPPK